MTSRTQTRYVPRRLRRWFENNELSARHLNEAVDAVQRLILVPTSVREIVPSSTTTPHIQQFRVAAVHGDYLTCNRLDGAWDAQEDDGVYYVAKPYLLRRTPFETDGRNSISYDYDLDSDGSAIDGAYQRTASNEAGVKEDQTIVPSYQVGDIIYAVQNVRGMRLTIERADGEEIQVRYLDLNTDGRAWAQAQ